MQDVFQIFGRGCRSQGHGVGSIYTLKSDKGTVYAQIEAADDLRSCEPVDVDAKLFQHIKQMDQPDIDLMAKLWASKDVLTMPWVQKNNYDAY